MFCGHLLFYHQSHTNHLKCGKSFLVLLFPFNSPQVPPLLTSVASQYSK